MQFIALCDIFFKDTYFGASVFILRHFDENTEAYLYTSVHKCLRLLHLKVLKLYICYSSVFTAFRSHILSHYKLFTVVYSVNCA